MSTICIDVNGYVKEYEYEFVNENGEKCPIPDCYLCHDDCEECDKLYIEHPEYWKRCDVW